MAESLEDFIKSMDDLKGQFNNIEGSRIRPIIEEFAHEVVFQSQANLEEAGRIGSGSLSNSIEPQYEEAEDGKITLNFIADYYWEFNDQGVNGVQNNFGAPFSFKSLNPSKSMVDSFMGTDKQNWLALKGITQAKYTDANGNIVVKNLVSDSDYRGWAYVLARATKRKGIEPTYYLSSIFNEERIDKLASDLGDAVINVI